MRLTKKKPDGNFEAVLNLFYCKDMTTWVRGGGPAPEYRDVKLDDWIRGVVKRFNAYINVDEMNDEELNMQMAELMIGEEMETIEDFIALFYNASWAFSALNARLMEYEDTGLSPEEIAEMKGRIVVLCRDCKRYNDVFDDGYYYGKCCDEFHMDGGPDFFCAYGERKNGADMRETVP